MAPTAAVQAMLNGPALTPPSGVQPNFTNPPNMDRTVILVITLCTTFSTIAILLRLYTKLFVLRKVVFEDCTCQCRCCSGSTDVSQTLSFWDGWGPWSKSLKSPLTVAVDSDRGKRDSFHDHQIRRWSTSMECTSGRLLQNALCIVLVHQSFLPTFTKVVVGQHRDHGL